MAKLRESKKTSLRKSGPSSLGAQASSWFLVVGVKPGQSRCFLRGGTSGEGAPSWVVGVREPAREGRANEGVVRALAGFLGASLSSVTLVSGHGSRVKRLSITGVTESEGLSRLRAESEAD